MYLYCEWLAWKQSLGETDGLVIIVVSLGFFPLLPHVEMMWHQKNLHNLKE